MEKTRCIYPPLLGKMFVGATFVIATSPVFASGADLPVVNRPVAVASPQQSATTITGVVEDQFGPRCRSQRGYKRNHQRNNIRYGRVNSP